jgi:hypothetical protein
LTASPPASWTSSSGHGASTRSCSPASPPTCRWRAPPGRPASWATAR